MKYLSIIFFTLIFIGCSNFDVSEKVNSLKPEHITVSTDRIELKKSEPFNLSTLYMRLFNLKMKDQNKYVIGFYYFGKEKAELKKINLKIDNKIHELFPRVPSEIEDFGMMGIAEEFYIRIPNKLLSSIIISEKVKLCVIGEGFKYSEFLNKTQKENIKKFINYEKIIAYNN